jgi:riboflavin transporter FmnP
MSKSTLRTTILIKTALLGAVAFVLMRTVRFPIPGFPTFLEVDFSELPAIIGCIVVGPFVGLGVAVLKNGLALFNSYTGGVGELANLLVSLGYLLPLALMTRKNTQLNTVIFALIIGIFSMTGVGILANYFILAPLYGLEIDKIAYIFTMVLPFNLIKGTIVSIASLVCLKAMEPALNYLGRQK